jgi:hypothetical protein
MAPPNAPARAQLVSAATGDAAVFIQTASREQTADQLTLAFAARDRGIQQVTDTSDNHDINVVDQAIRAVASRGSVFTANDVRPLLPALRSNNLIGARFQALKKAGVIRRVKGQYVPSTEPGTHGHPIAVWEKA